jgi:nitroreductase
MLNDLSSTLTLLETRRSGRPREMTGDGPNEEELERILTIAARTPDHGKLFPWRFVTVGTIQREALAALLHRALDEHDPSATEAHHEKEDEFARNGGALVGPRFGAGARPQDSGVGAGIVVRRGRHEPPDGCPCARLCRRLADGLAGV